MARYNAFGKARDGKWEFWVGVGQGVIDGKYTLILIPLFGLQLD
jgi:hypothetical protein